MAAVLWATARAGRQPPNERLVTSAMTAATAAADFRFLGGDATAASLSTLAARHHSPDNCDAGRTSPQTSIASEAPDVPHPSASPHAQSPPPPPPASSTWKLVIRPSDLARLLWSSAKMGLPSAATSFSPADHQQDVFTPPGAATASGSPLVDPQQQLEASSNSAPGAAASGFSPACPGQQQLQTLARAAAASLHRMSPTEACASVWALAHTAVQGMPLGAVTRQALAIALSSRVLPQLLPLPQRWTPPAVPPPPLALPDISRSSPSPPSPPPLPAAELSRLAWSMATLGLPLPAPQWRSLLTQAASSSSTAAATSAREVALWLYAAASAVVSEQQWSQRAVVSERQPTLAHGAERGISSEPADAGSACCPSARRRPSTTAPSRRWAPRNFARQLLLSSSAPPSSASLTSLPPSSSHFSSSSSSSPPLALLFQSPPDSLEATLLVDALWALSRLGLAPEPAWLLQACQVLAGGGSTQRKLQELRPRCLVKLCQALAYMPQPQPPRGNGGEVLAALREASGPVPMQDAAPSLRKVGTAVAEPLGRGLLRPLWQPPMAQPQPQAPSERPQVPAPLMSPMSLLSAAASAAIGSSATPSSPLYGTSGSRDGGDSSCGLSAPDAASLLWSLRQARVTMPPGLLLHLSLAIHRGHEERRLPADDLARSVLALAEAWPQATAAAAGTGDGAHESGAGDMNSSFSPAYFGSSGKAASAPLAAVPAGSAASASPTAPLPATLPLAVSLASLGDPASEEPLLRLMSADELTMLMLGLAKLGQPVSAAWKESVLGLIKVRTCGEGGMPRHARPRTGGKSSYGSA